MPSSNKEGIYMQYPGNPAVSRGAELRERGKMAASTRILKAAYAEAQGKGRRLRMVEALEQLAINYQLAAELPGGEWAVGELSKACRAGLLLTSPASGSTPAVLRAKHRIFLFRLGNAYLLKGDYAQAYAYLRRAYRMATPNTVQRGVFAARLAAVLPLHALGQALNLEKEAWKGQPHAYRADKEDEGVCVYVSGLALDTARMHLGFGNRQKARAFLSRATYASGTLKNKYGNPWRARQCRALRRAIR